MTEAISHIEGSILVSQTDAAVLCGGLGTRLRPVVPDRPKAMVEIYGRPFLEILVEYLARSGFRRIIMCVGFKAEAIVSYFEQKRFAFVDIIFNFERTLAGTAGAIAEARPLFLSERIVVLNGDTFCAVDYNDLLKKHTARGSVATLVVCRAPDRSDYGSVKMDRQSIVRNFAEKTSGGSGWINAGIYVLSLGAIEQFPPERPLSMERDILPNLASCGKLWAYRTSGPFFDIGTPERYAKARRELRLASPGTSCLKR